MLKLLKIGCIGLLVGAATGFFGSPAASAHPVAFAGSTSIMVDATDKRHDFQAFYSFRYWAAAGGTYTRLLLPLTGESSEHGAEHEETLLLTPQFNLLAWRLNRLNSQTNLYVKAGYGGYQSESGDRQRAAGRYGLQFDSETRRLYTLVKAEYLELEGADNIESYVWRGGIAPYLGEFDELNIWFIFQAKYAEAMDKKPVLTPMLRFYYKNVLWEVGSALRGGSYLSFMVHM